MTDRGMDLPDKRGFGYDRGSLLVVDNLNILKANALTDPGAHRLGKGLL